MVAGQWQPFTSDACRFPFSAQVVPRAYFMDSSGGGGSASVNGVKLAADLEALRRYVDPLSVMAQFVLLDDTLVRKLAIVIDRYGGDDDVTGTHSMVTDSEVVWLVKESVPKRAGLAPRVSREIYEAVARSAELGFPSASAMALATSVVKLTWWLL